MDLEASCLRKTLPAIRTFVRSLSGMNTLVNVQLRPLQKGLLAQLALVWLLSCMRPHVRRQVVDVRAFEAALRTVVRFRLGVRALVGAKIASRQAQLSTFVTFEPTVA